MPLRILHLEDDPLDRELIERQIRKEGFEPAVVAVDSREAFIEALRQQKFDLIISDYVIPGYGGGEAMEAASKFAPEAPFVFVSGRMPEEIAVDKLRRGAADHICKSHLARLGPIVRRIVREQAEASRYRVVAEELATAAQAAGFGVFNHDLIADTVEWSAELKAMFGLPMDAPVTRAQASALVHPEDKERVQARWIEASDARGNGNFESEHRVVTGNGEARWVLVKARVTFEGEGSGRRPARIAGVVIDLTERRAAEMRLRENEAQVRKNLEEAARAQAALRASEERLEAVVENLAEGLIVADADGRVILWNRAALQMHGYSALSDVQRSMREFADTNEVSTIEGRVLPVEDWPLSRILRGERVQNMEARWRRLDMDLSRVVSYAGQMVQSPDGSRLAFLIITDITERKRAEASLRESEGHLRRVLDNLFAFVGVLDSDCVLREVNRAPLEVAGLTAEQVIGRKFWECPWWSHSGEIRARVREACERALQGIVSRFDVETAVADGKTLWIDFQIAPLRDSSGRVTHLVPSAMDITGRRAAEQALRESADRFRTLADNMSQLAWMADETGAIFWYNERWFEFTGTTLEDMRGWGWRKVHHPDYLQRVEEKFRHHIAIGETWEDTFPLRGRNGQYRWFLSRAVPIRDAEGRVTRWFGTNTDVTERLQAEQALREADRRKDEFLAMLGHELRNPLSAVRNATTILKEGASDPASVEWAHAILERQGTNLARMVDDLLDVARITRGQVELKRTEVALGQIARSACEVVKPLIQARQHSLQLRIEGKDGPHVLGDAARLEQVVVNLLTNAIKYTPAGGAIMVSSRQERDDAVLSVRDTGIGMPPDLLPHIFELFTQGNRSLDRSEGGLGIGLSLCRQLISMHGGVIEAHSEGLGRGSEFIVRLPLLAAAETEAPGGAGNGAANGAVASARGAGQDAAHGRGKRVLVVDDNVDTARSMGRLLTKRGFEVSLAYDGPSGEQAAREFAPEICLLDIGLPGFDGYELARRLRAGGPCQEALIVAISGYAQEGDRQRSRVAGFDAHLAKPVDLDKLFDLMAESVAK